MRRTLALACLPALLAAGACTSDQPVTPEPTTDDSAVTSDDGLEGQAMESGWYCRYIAEAYIDEATGGQTVSPRESMVSDTADDWICEVLSGGPGEQQPVVRISVLMGEGSQDEARSRAENADGVEEGPEFLGESYISPGLVTGLVPCRTPGGERFDDLSPFAIVAESFIVDDEATTGHLRNVAGQAAQQLDQALGCQPRLARQESRSG